MAVEMIVNNKPGNYNKQWNLKYENKILEVLINMCSLLLIYLV